MVAPFSFVAAAEDVEQQLAPALREGHIAEFVDDRQADPGELVLKAEQPLLVARLDHLVDELGGGGEAHGEALLAGGEAGGDRDVRLAHTAGSEDTMHTSRHYADIGIMPRNAQSGLRLLEDAPGCSPAPTAAAGARQRCTP